MAGAGAIRAGRAFIEFFGDDSKLNNVLTGLQTRLKSWGKSIAKMGTVVAAAGAAIEGPMLAAAKVFASTSAEVFKFSEMTGIGAESVLSFMGAAKRAGVELEDVGTGVKKMQKSIFEAALGSEKAQMALRHLGLNARMLINMRPEDQFRLIAERLSMIANPAIRTGVALEIMGKSAATLIPLMLHLRELEERGKRSGPGITAADIKAGHELELSFLDLTSAMKKFTLQIGAAVAPQVQKVVDTIVAVIARVNQWVKDNRALVLTVFQVAAVVMIVGTALVFLGGVLTTLAFVIGTVSTIFGAIVAVLMFLISPIGLVIAGLIGLTVAFFKCTDMGSQALAFLGEAFAGLKADALQAFQGIRDALSSGDIALAWTVLVSFLSLQWAKVVAFLKNKWAEFLNYLVPPAVEIAGAISDVFTDMSTAIASALLDALDAIGELLGTQVLYIDQIQTALTTLLGPLGIIAGLPLDVLAGINTADARAGLADENKGRKVANRAFIAGVGKKLVDDADAGAAAALDDVDKARTKFDDAVDKARKGQKEFAPGETPFGSPMGVGDFGMAKAAVSGTFSAAAAAGLAGSNDLTKVADNTLDMKNTLKQINNKKPGPPVV